MSRSLIHIDAQDFSGNGWLVILDIRRPVPDRRSSGLGLQQRFVLVILSIHSWFFVPLRG